MAGVTLELVSKTFHAKRSVIRAVDDVSFCAADGEFVVLVGPSGCGKTTTLRLIAGLEEPSAGTIRIGDRVVNRVAPKDRDVAMVFQSYALYPHMTVRKNMAFGLKMRGTPRAEIKRKVTDAAEMLGLTALLDRKPASLSGGERQRVALGRAIVRTPNVFLLDEPLSNLDARLRIRMRTELKALHRRLGTTIIHVTHDQEEAMTLGDRIVVLNLGAIQQVGAPLDIYRNPANRFVAGFFGNPPMNFLEGKVMADGADLCVLGALGRMPFAGDRADGLRALVGHSVTLGVRPEDVRISIDSGSRAADAGSVTSQALLRIENARVHLVEPLGDRTIIHLAAGDEGVVATVPPTMVLALGDTVTLAVDPARMHVFASGDTGVRLTPIGSRCCAPPGTTMGTEHQAGGIDS